MTNLCPVCDRCMTEQVLFTSTYFECVDCPGPNGDYSAASPTLSGFTTNFMAMPLPGLTAISAVDKWHLTADGGFYPCSGEGCAHCPSYLD